MKEYIERASAERAIAAIMPSMSTPDGAGTNSEMVFATQEMCADVLSAVHHLPAADVAPVRHGRWVFDGGDEYADHYHCDQCGTKTDLCNEIYTEQKPNYCPNCGARVGKEDEPEQ